MRKLLWLVVGLCALFAVPAEAKQWVIDYKNSSLTFTGTQTAKPFTGHFANYVATINLDPKKPETGKVEMQIDVRTAKTGDSQRDTALPQPEWFDANNIPFAEFQSTEIKRINETQFEMKGLLKIKLITKEVTLPFTLERANDGVHAKTEITINRNDYQVGTGEWASDQWVGYPVTIKADLMAY